METKAPKNTPFVSIGRGAGFPFVSILTIEAVRSFPFRFPFVPLRFPFPTLGRGNGNEARFHPLLGGWVPVSLSLSGDDSLRTAICQSPY